MQHSFESSGVQRQRQTQTPQLSAIMLRFVIQWVAIATMTQVPRVCYHILKTLCRCSVLHFPLGSTLRSTSTVFGNAHADGIAPVVQWLTSCAEYLNTSKSDCFQLVLNAQAQQACLKASSAGLT